ncbi:MAG: hypothetical protein KBD31_00460 [Proteobacteria bacterium]|nr:hypothetical protein [Pseudomonadota bacterium]
MTLSPTILPSIAVKAWKEPFVDNDIASNILYNSISSDDLNFIRVTENGEELIDLKNINHPRLKPLSSMDHTILDLDPNCSKVRFGVFKRLLNMLDLLPENIGIAYFEGLRPLYLQKQYFDKKFKEMASIIENAESAYIEASKSVAPFIDNIPPHSTGGAIDMTLYKCVDFNYIPLDMGKFDVTTGEKNQQETFSENTSKEQRINRLLLVNAAIKAGFVNYGFEWWHYSYGDRAWAYVLKKDETLYDMAVSKDDPILLIKKSEYIKSILSF